MDAKAKSRGFVVVTPDGIDNQFDYAAPSVDFTFTEDLVRYLDSILCISPTKRFSTGMSNGGAMSGAVACLPGATPQGHRGRDRHGPRVRQRHQDATALLPRERGSGRELRRRRAGDRVVGDARRMRRDAGGNPHRARHPEADVHRLRRGESATLYTVEGGGHTWPDGIIDLPQFGNTTRTIDATDLILDFFASQ